MTRLFGWLAILALPLVVAGCSSLGASGPSTRAVKSAGRADPRIKVVELTDSVARHVIGAQRNETLSQLLGDAPPQGSVVGLGDVLDISIWEAPPAALFGTTAADARLSLAPVTSRGSEIPQQMVNSEGQITVPFVGSINVAGRTTHDISREIVRRLSGRAHEPQAIVRIAENQAANVTVVGDVANSRRVALTTKGERLLDVLAAAGGVRQPVDKIMIQVTRGNRVVQQPLGSVIRTPPDNIRLAADDVVTALHQPFSFQALGAIGNNAEINFEGTGITLAQALGRIGGLQDNRADVKGVFIFRLEDPAALPPELANGAQTTPDGKIPVIYRVDMANPATFFVAQGFPIRNKDVIYVSNAPLSDLFKFVNVVSQMTFSVVNIGNIVDQGNR